MSGTLRGAYSIGPGTSRRSNSTSERYGTIEGKNLCGILFYVKKIRLGFRTNDSRVGSGSSLILLIVSVDVGTSRVS